MDVSNTSPGWVLFSHEYEWLLTDIPHWKRSEIDGLSIQIL